MSEGIDRREVAGVEILSYRGEGYQPLVSFNNWRVAVIRYMNRLDHSRFSRLERHLLTDEVFILLSGAATLVIGMQLQSVPMEPERVYNVRKGVWHGICLSGDACVAVMENDNTGAANTEYITLEKSVHIEGV
ncbi:MAG: hypothetical protein K0R57_6345 [Paenibacillaceae bacterium]|jgi:mannose-6-phosphate isomerase-like protein (cupin superfamily)|nr:hypothetical protein [Paenibacillaceae bacterium]